MTVIIVKLAKKNLITVTDDRVADQRKKYITLTKEGAKTVSLMQGQFIEFFAPLTQGLSKKDFDAYLKVMTTIIANAKNKRTDNDPL